MSTHTYDDNQTLRIQSAECCTTDITFTSSGTIKGQGVGAWDLTIYPENVADFAAAISRITASPVNYDSCDVDADGYFILDSFESLGIMTIEIAIKLDPEEAPQLKITVDSSEAVQIGKQILIANIDEYEPSKWFFHGSNDATVGPGLAWFFYWDGGRFRLSYPEIECSEPEPPAPEPICYFTVTTKSSQISASLSQTYIDLSLITANEWWAEVDASGNGIRVETEDDQFIDHRLLTFNKTSKTGILLVETEGWISTSADKTLKIHAVKIATPSNSLFWSSYSPKLFYPFDEVVGSTISNIANSSHYSNVTGTITRSAGKIGNAYDFANNAYLRTIASNPLATAINFTMSTWIKFPSIAYDNNFLFNFPESEIALHGTYDGYVQGSMRQHNYNVTSAMTISTDTWYLLTYTYDGTDLKIYINGGLSQSQTVIEGFNQTTNRLVIGARYDYAQGYAKSYDSLRIYDRALTANEIITQYRNENTAGGIWTSGTLTYWTPPIIEPPLTMSGSAILAGTATEWVGGDIYTETMSGGAILSGNAYDHVPSSQSITMQGGAKCGSRSLAYLPLKTIRVPAGTVSEDLAEFFFAAAIDIETNIDAVFRISKDDSLLPIDRRLYDGKKLIIYFTADLKKEQNNDYRLLETINE